MSKEKDFVDLLNNEMKELVDDFAKRKIADLEAKLAEKEKSISFWKRLFDASQKALAESIDRVNEILLKLVEKEEEIEEYKRICTISHIEDLQIENMLLKGKDQEKTEFAINKLQWLKEKIDNAKIHRIDMINTHELNEILDQQIAELKKENK